jgi:hypothetical protein
MRMRYIYKNVHAYKYTKRYLCAKVWSRAARATQLHHCRQFSHTHLSVCCPTCDMSTTYAGTQYRWYEHAWTRGEVVRRLQRVLSQDLQSDGQAREVSDHSVFVAADTATGQLCGLVELIKLPYPCAPGPLRPYLFNLCVRQDLRKKGITILKRTNYTQGDTPRFVVRAIRNSLIHFMSILRQKLAS